MAHRQEEDRLLKEYASQFQAFFQSFVSKHPDCDGDIIAVFTLDAFLRMCALRAKGDHARYGRVIRALLEAQESQRGWRSKSKPTPSLTPTEKQTLATSGLSPITASYPNSYPANQSHCAGR